MTGGSSPDIAPLERRHRLDAFRCSSEAQTDWLRRHGHTHRKAGTSAKVNVIAEPGNPDVVIAYFAWCMSGVASAALPARFLKGAGGYQMQPFVLLARLGVHVDHEGNGIGRRMLRHVMLATHDYSKEIGCRGLLVHAETSEAVEFYKRWVPDFAPSPDNDTHLMLLAKDIGASGAG